MQPDDFAQWMHQEHDRVRDLCDALRSQVAVTPRTQLAEWLTEVRERFSHLRAHLHKHMSMEEQDGYLSTVVERRPTLSDEVERLKHEHAEVSEIMDRLCRDMEKLTPEDPLLIGDAQVRIHYLLSCLDRHENDENLLVISVFTDDIGSKD